MTKPNAKLPYEVWTLSFRLNYKLYNSWIYLSEDKTNKKLILKVLGLPFRTQKETQKNDRASESILGFPHIPRYRESIYVYITVHFDLVQDSNLYFEIQNMNNEPINRLEY